MKVEIDSLRSTELYTTRPTPGGSDRESSPCARRFHVAWARPVTEKNERGVWCVFFTWFFIFQIPYHLFHFLHIRTDYSINSVLCAHCRV